MMQTMYDVILLSGIIVPVVMYGYGQLQNDVMCIVMPIATFLHDVVALC